MKLAMTLFLLWLSIPSKAIAQTRHDGNWWNTQVLHSKVDYLIGFLDGMDLGNAYTTPPLPVDKGGGIVKERLAELERTSEFFGARTEKYLSHVTIGQIRDGVDEFFKDFRNRSIVVTRGIDVVLHQIAGEDMENFILLYRQMKH